MKSEIISEFISTEKDKYKLFTFLGAVAGLVVSMLISFLIAQNNEDTLYVSFIAFFGPLLGAMGGNFLGKKIKSDSENNEEDMWNKSNDTEKVRKSKFSSDGSPEITIFGAVIAVVFSYLSIYLSEVLNLSKNFQKNYPNSNFFEIFLEVAGNILKEEWSNRYIIKYWIGITVFLIMMIIGAFLGIMRLNKMEKKEREMRNKNKSKFQ